MTTDLEQATKGVSDSTDHTGKEEHRNTYCQKDSQKQKCRKDKNINN